MDYLLSSVEENGLVAPWLLIGHCLFFNAVLYSFHCRESVVRGHQIECLGRILSVGEVDRVVREKAVLLRHHGKLCNSTIRFKEKNKGCLGLADLIQRVILGCNPS